MPTGGGTRELIWSSVVHQRATLAAATPSPEHPFAERDAVVVDLLANVEVALVRVVVASGGFCVGLSGIVAHSEDLLAARTFILLETVAAHEGGTGDDQKAKYRADTSYVHGRGQ